MLINFNLIFLLFKAVIISLILLLFTLIEIKAFEVVTWNIQKGKNVDWKIYINDHPNIDFLGIQEATSDSEIIDTFNLNYYYFYNPAWENSIRSTGTLSAWKNPNDKAEGFISDVLEPIILTPKSFIISDHDLGCDIKIKIVNVHMINFLLGTGYQSQLQQIKNNLKKWKGPLIVLGDFNDWNFLRTETLLQWTLALDLKLAHLGDHKIFGLDHIFYRNLEFQKLYLGPKNLSDHRPLHAEFSCLTKNEEL